MFEKIKKNLEAEKKILFDMASIASVMTPDNADKGFYESSLKSFQKQIALLNDAIPDLLKEEVSIDEDPKVKKEEKKRQKKASKMAADADKLKSGVNGEGSNLTVANLGSKKESNLITISKKDKKKFMEELKLTNGVLKKAEEVVEEKEIDTLSNPGAYVKFSNRIFRKKSDKISDQFIELGKNLKKANSRYLLSSYLSMAMMSLSIAFIAGSAIFGYMMFLNAGNIIYIAIPFGGTAIVALLFYVYPSTEATSVQKKISQELPFVAIYMSAIAGSNIEPIKVFKIIASSKDYPNIAREFRKIVSQIEIYGYDLTLALKNVAGRTSNKDLAELFSGIATNISTGGGLKNYLEKKSENFLNDYKLERQKYSALAGTFMDVYISILIAAPLIMTMMFIVMNVAGLGMGGLGIQSLLMFGVLGIAVANVIFLFVLNAKQPNV